MCKHAGLHNHNHPHTPTHSQTHSSPGLGGPCQNILVTAPHTQLKQGNTSPICFLNSWYIIHSVTHSRTHTHTSTHPHTWGLSLYKYTLERASSSSVGGAESAWLILGERSHCTVNTLCLLIHLFTTLSHHNTQLVSNRGLEVGWSGCGQCLCVGTLETLWVMDNS